MKKLLLPLILLILGSGGGVGAGIFLTAPPAEDPVAIGPCGDLPGGEMLAAADAHAPDAHAPDAGASPDGEAAMAEPAGDATGYEYVKMSNQFVIPVVGDGAVRAMVVLTISVEVTLGNQTVVFTYEPKLRDVFLQVLFDHANVGGFDGTFTSAENMRTLRRALRLAGQAAVGAQIHDVLITDIVRQDV